MFKKLFLLALLFGFSFGDELDSLVKKCNNYDGQACLDAALLYEKIEKDNNKRIEFKKPILAKSCDLGEGMGCFNLAAIHLSKDEVIQAKEIFEKACDELKHPLSCSQLGTMYRNIDNSYGETNLKKAKFYHKKACKLGYQLSCNYAKEL